MSIDNKILDLHIQQDYFKKSQKNIKSLLLEPLTNNEELKKRIYTEKGNTTREPFERDYTRVLYCPSFRRLQGKMQLLAIKNDKFFRNRLTHSLEVAQIARAIARDIGYSNMELYIVEAGALAHDIGNPPFGHYGENILNEIAKEFGGYEGNAQTFRILTSLEKKAGHNHGLNLTKRTILSVLKYFRTYDDCKKEDKKPKYIYDDSYQIVEKIKDSSEVKLRTLDVQIVDVADEIAYAAHDLEDGLSQGLFTIDEILFAFKKQYPFKKDVENEDNQKVYDFLCAIIENAKNWAAEYASSTSEYSALFNNKISSLITYHLINDLGLVKRNNKHLKQVNGEQEKELYFTSLEKLANGLKKITFECITNTDEVYFYEQAGEKIIKSLFNLFYEKPMYLPEEYRIPELIKYIKRRKGSSILEGKEKVNFLKIDNEHKRNVIDYISGMMDSYAISEYERFFGESAVKGFYRSSEYDSKGDKSQ